MLSVPDLRAEGRIWNKLAVGVLAVAMIAVARAWLGRERMPELPLVGKDMPKDIEEFYAAGL
jgi:hypothetical protein